MTERETAGTLAEEAAKLLATLHGWVGDPAAADASPDDEPPFDDDEARRDEQGSEAVAPECRWCPVCQLMRVAKATSPDVREHLSQAAVSLALALQGLLDGSPAPDRRATPLEKIDLTED